MPARAPCSFFARGRCNRGSSCPFLHELASPDICRFFAAGRCAHGESCRFAHEGAVTVPTRAPCRFFAAGRCARGEECRFAHDEALRDDESAAAVEDPRKNVPCHFFAVGGCHNGEACPFLHDLALQVDAELDPVAEAARFCLETDDLVDDWTRVMDGAVVKFGDGASVETISLASDFSAVRLDNLPPDSSPASVVELLEGLGVLVWDDDVVQVRVGARAASADVKVEDPSFAATVRERLSTAARGSAVRATRIDVPMPSGSSLHRVDCRRVLCSWHSPRRTVWLNFTSWRDALDAYDHLALHRVRVRGRPVVPGAPAGPRHDCWTVRLPNMDPDVDELDFYDAAFLPRSLRPDRVALGRPSYDAGAVDAVAGLVQARLRGVGPLESWSVTAASRSGTRVKAQARFENEADAKRAAELLDGAKLQMPAAADGSRCDALELAVQHVPVAIIKVSRRIYGALKAVVDRQREIWSARPGGSVHIATFPSAHGHVVLRLQGGNTRTVAEAHAVLSDVFKGTELEVSRDAWRSVIQNHGSWRDISQRISRDYGVTVVRDRRRSQLRVFGELGGHERTRRRIAAEVEKCLAEARVVELDDDAYRWACWGGGFKELAAQMGRDRLAMDTVSTPKRILCLGGSERDYEAVVAVVYGEGRSGGNKDGTTTTTTTTTTATATTDCCVCWTEAEDAMETPCGHVYCGGCFVGLCCSEEATAGDGGQIACVGDGDRCREALPLPSLKEHLSSAQFEKVLQDAFALHVRRHPHDFRLCPTPDCGRVYRVSPAAAETEEGAVFTCPACIQSTCTACHGPAHRGCSCAEHRDVSTGGYEALARAKVELGVHDCPRCKTLLEKTEGCNHMTCSCGAHICWKCLAVFDTSEECYSHLNAKHDGFYDDLPPDDDDDDDDDDDM